MLVAKGLLPWPDSPVVHGKTSAHTPADAEVVGSSSAGQEAVTQAKEGVFPRNPNPCEHKVLTETAHVGDEVRIASVGLVIMLLSPFFLHAGAILPLMSHARLAGFCPAPQVQCSGKSTRSVPARAYL